MVKLNGKERIGRGEKYVIQANQISGAVPVVEPLIQKLRFSTK